MTQCFYCYYNWLSTVSDHVFIASQDTCVLYDTEQSSKLILTNALLEYVSNFHKNGRMAETMQKINHFDYVLKMHIIK